MKIGDFAPARIMHTGASARVRRHIRDASNADIIGLVTEAMRDRSVVVSWPHEFDPNEAPLMVWECLRSFRYVADGDGQVIQSPRVLLNTGTGDCKSFAVFACKTLHAAGWQTWARFVKNEPGDLYGHVYCVAERAGQWVAVDGVLDQFDEEPLHFGSLDVPLQ